jgi:hypothetical protein
VRALVGRHDVRRQRTRRRRAAAACRRPRRRRRPRARRRAAAAPRRTRSRPLLQDGSTARISTLLESWVVSHWSLLACCGRHSNYTLAQYRRAGVGHRTRADGALGRPSGSPAGLAGLFRGGGTGRGPACVTPRSARRAPRARTSGTRARARTGAIRRYGCPSFRRGSGLVGVGPQREQTRSACA